MPRVPDLNELQVDRRGIDVNGFTAGQTRATEASTGGDIARSARSMSSGGGGRDVRAVAPARANTTDFATRDSQTALGMQAQLAENIGHFGAYLNKIQQEMKEKADEARVMDARNSLDAAYLDAANNPQSGWKMRKGKDALNNIDRKSLAHFYNDNMEETYQKIASSLSNDEQKAAFAQYAKRKSLEQMSDIQTHANREYEEFKTAGYKGGIANAQNQIINGDDVEIERGVGLIREYNARYARENGLPDEWLEERNREDASRAVSQAIAQRLDAGDLPTTARMLAQYDPYLDGTDKAKLTSIYKTAHETREVTALAEADFASGNNPFQASAIGDPYAQYNRGFNLERAKQKLFSAESGGNATAKNKNTSAYGKAQFIKGTWDLFGKSPIGQSIRGTLALGSAAWYELRSDPRIAEIATEWYFDYNKKQLEKAGVPWNDATAYLSHFAGAAGAIAIYKAPPNMSAGEALQKAGIKGWKEKVEKNPTILKGTTADVMAIMAKKMGVQATTLPTGEPQAPQRMTDAQLNKYAANRFPDKPDMQRLYINQYQIQRDVEAEAVKQRYDTTYTALREELAANGGDLSALPVSLRESLRPADQRLLQDYALNIRNKDESQTEKENYGIVLAMTDERWLNTHSEADIMREIDAVHITPQQGVSIVQKQRVLQKEKTGEGPKVFNIKKDYGDAALNDMIKRYTGIDTYGTLSATQKAQVERIKFFADEAGQKILEASGGQSLDRKAFEAELINIMRETFKNRDSGDKQKVWEASIGDVEYQTLYDRSGGNIQHKAPVIKETKHSNPVKLDEETEVDSDYFQFPAF
ncbi:MAG: hypothetical protein Q4A74_01650 [Cardiobacteriaceae bacterium]|nr:hypothetical protein [Cardiobacteriaceae bacterium]